MARRVSSDIVSYRIQRAHNRPQGWVLDTRACRASRLYYATHSQSKEIVKSSLRRLCVEVCALRDVFFFVVCLSVYRVRLRCCRLLGSVLTSRSRLGTF